MPWAAISTGAADVIARPGAIGAELLRLVTCNGAPPELARRSAR
jgi:hypothetical protein